MKLLKNLKKSLFLFLQKTKIIKNGYLNPYLLWAFLICTPVYFFTVGQSKKYELDGEEIAAIIMNQEKIDTTWGMDEIAAPNDEIAEISNEQPTTSSIEIIPLRTESNLHKLIRKAKSTPNRLSQWDIFRLKVYQTAMDLKKRYPKLGGDEAQIYDWRMKTFFQESGYRHDAANPNSSARGLFQAMKFVRKRLGMKVGLSAVKQVDYYEKYICMMIDDQKMNVTEINTPLDWYLLVFYPALADKPDNYKFGSCCAYSKKYCCHRKKWRSCKYHANQIYDMDKNCVTYKKEIGEHLYMRYK